ncbi:MAG: hypothetical protein ACLQUZ_02860 [Rhizomicrobium sp.]
MRTGAADKMRLISRGYHRMLYVACTIAEARSVAASTICIEMWRRAPAMRMLIPP